MFIVTVILAVNLAICLLGIRNNLVHQYRVKALHTMLQASLKAGEPLAWWSARLDKFNTVRYNDMVFKFWKPIESFYEDKSFLQ